MIIGTRRASSDILTKNRLSVWALDAYYAQNRLNIRRFWPTFWTRKFFDVRRHIDLSDLEVWLGRTRRLSRILKTICYDFARCFYCHMARIIDHSPFKHVLSLSLPS